MVLAAGLGHPAAADHPCDAEADGAGPQPAGDGAHPSGCWPATGSPRRSPTCTGSRRRSRAISATAPSFGLELSYSREEQLLGHRRRGPQRRRLPRRLVPGDLRRRAHRHRPQGDAASSTSPTTGSRPWPPSGSPTPSQFGVVITGEDGRIQGFQEKPDAGRGALRPRQLLHLHVPLGDLRLLPRAGDEQGGRSADDPPGFADWAMDVFPALLEGDVPFYSHEIDAYWNDIGNLDELRQGNLDALRGAVAVEPGAPEVGGRGLGGQPARRRRGHGPGAGRRRGRDRRGRSDRGPGGPRRRLPDRRRRLVRDAILLDGRRVPPQAMLVGGIAATRDEAPDAISDDSARHARAAAPRIGHGAPASARQAPSCRRSAPPAAAPARAEAVLCGRCARRLADAEPLRGAGPAGIDRAWSSAPHEGVARDLVAALKFRRLLPVAGLMADRIPVAAPGATC